MNLIKETFINSKGDHYSLSSMIRYALHLRYMSLQAYKLLFEESPMLFLSRLNNIQQGHVDALKVLKTLYEKVPFLVTIF